MVTSSCPPRIAVCVNGECGRATVSITIDRGQSNLNSVADTRLPNCACGLPCTASAIRRAPRANGRGVPRRARPAPSGLIWKTASIQVVAEDQSPHRQGASTASTTLPRRALLRSTDGRHDRDPYGEDQPLPQPVLRNARTQPGRWCRAPHGSGSGSRASGAGTGAARRCCSRCCRNANRFGRRSSFIRRSPLHRSDIAGTTAAGARTVAPGVACGS
jgi:hypothetical protein